MSKKLINLFLATTKPVCKGLIFRGIQNSFIDSSGGYVYTERMRPLKRLSCKGCEQCGWLTDDLKEAIGNGCFPIINGINNGSLYQLKPVNETKDWETGLTDGYDLEFIELKEAIK